ncbi:MAG: hypothetical protein K8T90_04275 [Planctomycetes bacterium]|nr:hypothetical protein [Planctomycetota bacterium]
MTRRGFAVPMLLAALGATACSRSDVAAPQPGAAADTVAERVPPGATSDVPDPAVRIPHGSKVVRVSGAGEAALTDGLVAAGAPCVRPDGKALLFVAKEKDGDAYAVFECAADGSDRKVLVRHGTDCQSAAYLPDGRIVYAAAIDAPSPVRDARRAQALFVAKGDGTPGNRITFGGAYDADPTVLTDGRVLFASWRAGPAGAAGTFGLFTVHPDGSGYAAFHRGVDSAVRPQQTPDLDVRFRRLSDGAAFVASWDAPMSSVTAATGPARAMPLAARTRSQGHLSVAKAEVAFGTLYCVDARRGAPGAVAVRVRAEGPAARVLGTVPLAADGSFHLRVPADTPIVFEAVDAEGRAVAAEAAPIWVRGNETRGCVGCHDDVETAPPNVRPAAVRDAAVDISGTGGVR